MFLCVIIGFAVAAAAAENKFTLVIDPGHGGNDAGALGAFSKEKDINLNVALAFGKNVERNCPDVRVVYTRKGDQFVPLHERANIANRNKADLFISIHTNALPGGKISRGLETYTLGMHRAADNFDVAKRENSVILIEKDYKRHYEGFDPRSSESYIMFEFMQDKNMEQSVELARFVQRRACVAASRPDKGVKQAGFLVLRETSMPSCLIELGFITTPDEEQYLNTESGVNALAQGIYQAFVDYKRKYDAAIMVPYQAEAKQEVKIPTVVPQAGKPKKEAEIKKPEAKKEQGKAILEELAEARKQATEGQSVQSERADSDSNSNSQAAQRLQEESARVSAEPARAADKPTRTAEPAGAAEKTASAAEKSTGASGESAGAAAELVFKVQILASNRRLAPDDQQLKGVGNVECYEESGLYKYTCGASADYNEVYRLRKEMAEKFPGAFIIAFKGGNKVNVTEAVREFKNNRNKR